MREIDFEQMATVEKDHWWFSSKRKLFLYFLKKYSGDKKSVADIGCGTGETLLELKQNDFVPIGYDENDTAISYCEKKGLLVYKQDFLTSENIIGFDNIFFLDVLEHISNDKKAIQTIHSKLPKEGLLFLNVPAFNSIMAKHDYLVGHHRRYNVKEIRFLLEKNGFEIIKIGYWNFFLFLPITIIRKIKDFFVIEKQKSDVEKVFFPTNNALKLLLNFEFFLLKIGFVFPFGTSVYAIAKKLI